MTNHAVKTLRAAGAAVLVSGLVTACTVFPTPEAPRVMDLPPPQGVEKSSVVRPQRLRIDTPFASEPFNSTRILTKPVPWEFQVYGGVRWRDTVPVILRDMLAGAFRDNANYQAITMDTGPGKTDLNLATEVTAFQTVNQGDNTRATIAIYVQLIDTRSRKALCSERFIVSTPADNTSIEAVIQAFGGAGEKLAKKVIAWTNTCETSKD